MTSPFAPEALRLECIKIAAAWFAPRTTYTAPAVFDFADVLFDYVETGLSPDQKANQAPGPDLASAIDRSTAPTRLADIALCPACERRTDAAEIRACTSTDCPMAARKAA